MATPANVQIANFLKSAKQGAFKQITPQQVANGLVRRLAKPGDINQGSTSLCGPATLMFAVLRHKPDLYVQYVLDLYRTGKGQIGTLVVEPSMDCKNYKPPSASIDPVDWIALASIRDSENDVFDYDDVSDAAAGITMPGDLEEWFKKAGYSNTSNNTNLFFNKGINDLKSAGQQYLAGKNVFLFINAQVLYVKSMKNSSVFPDHWITLTSPINITGGKLSMSVFTWGQSKRRVPNKGQIDISDFLDDFYGYITAR